MADHALDLNGAGVQPHRLLDQGEPDARPLMSPRAGPPLNAVKPLENMRELFLRDSRAGVADNEPRCIRFPAQAYFNLTLKRELEGVGDEIQDDLFPHVPIHVHRLSNRPAIDNETHARLLDGRTEDARQFRSYGRQIDWVVRRLDAARLDAGEVEQSIHQLLKPQRISM